MEALAERSTVYTGFAANKAEILAGALENADAVVLATHSRIQRETLEGAGLSLSRYDAEGREIDGFLSLDAIQALDLEADLVVLSACESGWEQGVRGDGIVGFAQAFFVAGASQVVISQWPVEDEATAELMSRFYGHRLEEPGLPAAEALRRAQLEVRKIPGFEAPFYWAGFVVFGGDL